MKEVQIYSLIALLAITRLIKEIRPNAHNDSISYYSTYYPDLAPKEARKLDSLSINEALKGLKNYKGWVSLTQREMLLRDYRQKKN